MSHTVMVTGADGFIGSHLAEELVKSGEKGGVVDSTSYPSDYVKDDWRKR